MPSFWSKLKALFSKQNRVDFVVALVALYSAPRSIEPQTLILAIARAFDGEAPQDVGGEGNELFFSIQGVRLRVFGVPAPYLAPGVEQDAMAAKFSELRLRAAFLEHRSWYAIDVLSGDEATGYAVAGKLMAELLDETALAVLAPGAGGTPVDDDVRQAFREGRAGELVTKLHYDAITGVEATDVAMTKAIAEARRRWPEYVAAFTSGNPEFRAFIVKYPFGEGDQVEHMWVDVDGIEGDRVTGTSINQAFYLPRPRKGDRVELEAAKISDWAYIGPEGPIGSFSMAAVREAGG